MYPPRAPQVTPKIVNLYSKLFRGIPIRQITGPTQTQEQFYAELLTLDLDRAFISRQLEGASREICLGPLKGFLNSWFSSCIHWARSGTYDDIKKIHALETLAIIARCIFAKSFAGWEIMEALAGSVNESDAIFTEFTDLVGDILSDPKAPGALLLANIKHLTLQLALTYMCGAGQTSLGSYLLRRDLFPTIVLFVKNPDTEKFTFEAILFLCILANFHRSDAARLNPYLRRLSTCEDADFFRKINWATNFALNTAVQSYRNLSDDTPPQNLTTGIITLFATWRPDKALSATPVDPPKELFKEQPIEAAIALLPIFELVNMNTAFSSVLAHSIPVSEETKTEKPEQQLSPVLLTCISVSSYILAHASSASSPRASSYAVLSLKTLLAFVENIELLTVLLKPIKRNVQLSRQRQPTLPVQNGHRAPICATLDCCVLWLRHNLQYKLEVTSYILSINIVQRVLWYLRVNRVRLEYDWKDLWSATLGLLNFIASKAQSITPAIGVEDLIEETVALLECVLSQCEKILPSAKALHEFIYELIRFSGAIQKLRGYVRESAVVAPSAFGRTTWLSERTTEERLNNISQTVNFYEAKIASASAKTAKDAMRLVARELELEGLHGVKPTLDSEPPKRVEDAIGFVRHGYSDILALMH